MDEDVIGQVCVEIKHHQKRVEMTPNFLWVLKGVAATFEDSLLYSIASLIILPKYVADKSICQMEGSVKTKIRKIVDLIFKILFLQPFASIPVPRKRPTCISSREYVLL